MPRPRADGTPARPPHKRRLTELAVSRLKPELAPFLVWDSYQRSLVLRVHPTGRKTWAAVYHFHGRPRWLHLGGADIVGLADARRRAAKVLLEVADGRDPAAERQAERSSGTFADLAERYVERYAKKKNKSWQQTDTLVRRYLLPRWGKLQAGGITRSDAKALMDRIEAPVLANQILAAASSIFSWAVKQELVAANPCLDIDRNETHSRERVLADSEVPRFWEAFAKAGPAGQTLQMLLLTGQRPGEVACMRREHIVDGWWQLPGAPVPELGWPGTKNGQNHRVWLPAPTQQILAAASGGGFVFARRTGLDTVMRSICADLGAERATPHDLRRTHGSTITALGFGRDAMNRIQNHKEGGIASVYDRHGYAEEGKRVMEAVAAKIMALVEGEPAGNVVPLRVR
jgi:integrase